MFHFKYQVWSSSITFHQVLKGPMALIINSYLTKNKHCVKSVRIRSFYGLYSVRMRENTDQENSKYKHFSCIETEYY